MKSIINTLKVVAILFVLAFMLTLGSCEMFINWFGTSIEDRVEAFNDDLSAGKYSVLYKHFHSDTVDRYDMKNAPSAYWNTTFVGPDNAPARILSYSSGDTVTGQIENSSTSKSFSMQMKKDGMEYFIRTLEISESEDIRKLD
ncbi:MAG: hypothetical protein ACOC2R_08350 [Spirochaetota bacterium]